MVFAGTGVWKSKRGMSLFGRRCVFINDAQYSYNVRNELTSGQDQTYAYDDIGNRTTAEGKTYTANNLNQYTAIDDFTPQYDADGNQTLIKTETGIWSVVYNAENRPIRWQSGDIVITMAFDRMGRRVEMRTRQLPLHPTTPHPLQHPLSILRLGSHGTHRHTPARLPPRLWCAFLLLP